MMFSLSHFDFKIKENQLPMTRAALLCTILTSKKHADGISKLVYEADLSNERSLEGKNCEDGIVAERRMEAGAAA